MGFLCVYCGKARRKGVSYHKFPSCLEMRKKWVKNMGFDENFEVKSISRVCSDHFDENCFTKDTNDRERIHYRSIPTKFDLYSFKCVCCNNIKKMGSKIHFRKFPFKNKALLNLWLEKIGIEGFYPNEKSLICDAHFTKFCFYKKSSGAVVLKTTAFPSIFPTITLNDSKDFNEVVQLDTSTEIETLSENDNNEMKPTLTVKPLSKLVDPQIPIQFKGNLKSLLKPRSISANPKTSETSLTPKENYSIKHDHHYYTSTEDLARKYNWIKKRLQKSLAETKMQSRTINRLRQKVSILNDLIKEIKSSQPVSKKT